MLKKKVRISEKTNKKGKKYIAERIISIGKLDNWTHDQAIVLSVDEYESLVTEASTSTESKETLKFKLTNKQQQIESLEKTIDELKAKLDEANANHQQDLDNKIASIEHKHDECMIEKDATIKEISYKNHELDKEVSNLSIRLSDKESIIEYLKKTIDDKDSKFDKVESELSDKISEVMSLKEFHSKEIGTLTTNHEKDIGSLNLQHERDKDKIKNAFLKDAIKKDTSYYNFLYELESIPKYKKLFFNEDIKAIKRYRTSKQLIIEDKTTTIYISNDEK
ncbi:MAG: hypothetical protein MJ203_01500 [archaeon]|nr:hypothetical protein [archaeon]